MRRVSDPQAGEGNFFIRKQTSHKHKSPNIKKAKSKNKIKQYGNSQAIQRKTNSFSKSEQNQSSTFFTTKAKKSKKSDHENNKGNNLKKYQKQIMEILNASASKIQRQWRKYLIRKYKKQIQIKNRLNANNKMPKRQCDEQSVHLSQCSSFYNHAKYYSSNQEEFKKKAINPPEFSHTNLFSFQLPSPNLPPSPLATSGDIKSQCHQRTRSDQTAIPNRKIQYGERVEDKVLQITPKIIDMHIQGEEKLEKVKKKGQPQLKFQQHYIRLEKSSIDEIVNKLESKLEEKKLKKMLSLENNLSNNLMTFRSYKKSIESINQQHKRRLSNLQDKKKRLFLKLTEFVKLCEKNFQDLDADGEQDINHNLNKSGVQKKRNLADFQISFTSDISGFQNVQIIMDDSDFQTPFSEKKVRDKRDKNEEAFYQNKEKDDEIYIDDADRQNTLIHQLTCNEKDFEKSQQRSTNDRINNDEKQLYEAIYTPPKQNETWEKLNPKVLEDKKIQIQSSENNQKKKQQIADVNVNLRTFKKSEREIQEELKKFHPINPHIESVNHWLLEISHFILDNYGREFLQKLINVDQPNPLQLLRQSRKRIYYQKEYNVVSSQIFKSFEFYHIQSIANDENISEDKRQIYSVLAYTFHQALYESLNRMLLDELIEGRNWIKYPWSSERKLRRSIGVQHSKQCLQKAINRVSNISDYNLLPLEEEIDKGRQFEHNQQNLIFAEQVKQISLFSQIERGYILNMLSDQIEEEIISSEAKTFFKYFF